MRSQRACVMGYLGRFENVGFGVETIFLTNPICGVGYEARCQVTHQRLLPMPPESHSADSPTALKWRAPWSGGEAAETYQHHTFLIGTWALFEVRDPKIIHPRMLLSTGKPLVWGVYHFKKSPIKCGKTWYLSVRKEKGGGRGRAHIAEQLRSSPVCMFQDLPSEQEEFFEDYAFHDVGKAIINHLPNHHR